MMLDYEADVDRTNQVQTRFYSSDIQPLLQSLLSTLADIEFDYERERERVSTSTTEENLKLRLLQKLRDQHRERREPYIQHLTMLQQQIVPPLQCR